MSACLFLNNLLPRSFCRNVSFLEHLESDISIQLTVLMWPHNLSEEIKQSWAARCQCQGYLPQQVFMYILEIMFCWLRWWFRWWWWCASREKWIPLISILTSTRGLRTSLKKQDQGTHPSLDPHQNNCQDVLPSRWKNIVAAFWCSF